MTPAMEKAPREVAASSGANRNALPSDNHTAIGHLVNHPKSTGTDWRLHHGGTLPRDASTHFVAVTTADARRLLTPHEFMICPECVAAHDEANRRAREERRRVEEENRRQVNKLNVMYELAEAHHDGDRAEVDRLLEKLVEVTEVAS